MQLISLSFADLALAAIGVIALAVTTAMLRLGVARTLVVAAIRTAAQLCLVGLILEAVFAERAFVWIALIALTMLLLAGREAAARQTRRFTGGYGFAAGTISMFLSAFVTTVLTLVVVIRVEPWYTPQYAIPLLGMLLGNTMTGIALALDRLTQNAWREAAVIEAHLALGATAGQAVADIRTDMTALREQMQAVAAKTAEAVEAKAEPKAESAAEAKDEAKAAPAPIHDQAITVSASRFMPQPFP